MRQPVAGAESWGRDERSRAGAGACSPSGGQRRRPVGESEERPHVSARVPHRSAKARGCAESAQRGAPS